MSQGLRPYPASPAAAEGIECQSINTAAPCAPRASCNRAGQGLVIGPVDRFDPLARLIEGQLVPIDLLPFAHHPGDRAEAGGDPGGAGAGEGGQLVLEHPRIRARRPRGSRRRRRGRKGRSGWSRRVSGAEAIRVSTKASSERRMASLSGRRRPSARPDNAVRNGARRRRRARRAPAPRRSSNGSAEPARGNASATVPARSSRGSEAPSHAFMSYMCGRTGPRSTRRGRPAAYRPFNHHRLGSRPADVLAAVRRHDPTLQDRLCGTA